MKELYEKYVGKKGLIPATAGILVEVTVKDVKTSYGQNRFLVTPIAGKGEAWVENITLIDDCICICHSTIWKGVKHKDCGECQSPQKKSEREVA